MALNGAAGIKVTGNGTTFPTDAILNNTAIAADGGFTYNIDFLWDGTDSTVFTHVEKLISYAGTEDLQLDTTAANGSAILEMEFAADGGAESTAVSTTINKNTWYNVTLTFVTPRAIHWLVVTYLGLRICMLTASWLVQGQQPRVLMEMA